MSARKPIAFDLLTNATDSLRQAIEILALKELGDDHSRLKHAITSCAHCVELLTKEKLRRINPAFVWENVDRYPSLDARTVTVETAISRLRAIAGVTISVTDEGILKSLRKTRNAIEHYEWHASEKEARLIISNALSFALTFARRSLVWIWRTHSRVMTHGSCCLTDCMSSNVSMARGWKRECPRVGSIRCAATSVANSLSQCAVGAASYVVTGSQSMMK